MQQPPTRPLMQTGADMQITTNTIIKEYLWTLVMASLPRPQALGININKATLWVQSALFRVQA
jgi:hypothetical protein